MYRRVKTEGRALRKFPLVLRFLKAQDILESRVGYIIRKPTGKAVLRNAIRRILRETFRLHYKQLNLPVWVVFEVSDRVREITRTQLHEAANHLWQSLVKEAV